jgi:hypothetical protein
MSTPTFFAIKEILDNFFSKTATYSIQNGDPTKKLVLDTSKQLYFTTDFSDTKALNPLNDVEIIVENGVQNVKTSNINGQTQSNTWIYYVPIDETVLLQDSSVIDETPDNITFQNLGNYIESFKLIFYTNSIGQTNDSVREASIYQRLFFGLFNGLENINDYLEKWGIYRLFIVGRKVQNLSYVEATQGITRYEATFQSQFSIQLNQAQMDKLKEIQVEKQSLIF